MTTNKFPDDPDAEGYESSDWATWESETDDLRKYINDYEMLSCAVNSTHNQVTSKTPGARCTRTSPRGSTGYATHVDTILSDEMGLGKTIQTIAFLYGLYLEAVHCTFSGAMKVAIEGCCHGELDKIYETIAYLEHANNIKVDLLLICGDFQSVRNASDLHCMAVPAKYRQMNSFYKYYSGEKTAPVLTVFIGGNHEASNYLQELPYGGWVAPNIYYMGYANVIQFGGVRIGGLSGIYKPRDYERGHFERPPYNEDTKRSAYHIRNVDVFRLKQVSRPIDIMLSHDWPRGIYNHGNKARLIRAKRHFKDEVETNSLGSRAAEELLHHIKPAFWFSAHLHVKFAAAVQHHMEDGSTKITKFLALDKCLPKRQFLQVVDIPHTSSDLGLHLDPEWLMVLKSTNHLTSITPHKRFMPGLGSSDRWDFRVTDAEIASIKADFDNNLVIPDNFERTVPVFSPTTKLGSAPLPVLLTNPQTTLLCTMIELTDPNAEFLGCESSFNLDTSVFSGSFKDEVITSDNEASLNSSVNTTYSSSFSTTMNSSFNPDEIAIDDEDLVTGEITSESDLQPTTPSSSDEKDSESQSAGSDDVEAKIGGVEAKIGGVEKLVDDNLDDDELKDILAAQKSNQGSMICDSGPCMKTEADKLEQSKSSMDKVSNENSSSTKSMDGNSEQLTIDMEGSKSISNSREEFYDNREVISDKDKNITASDSTLVNKYEILSNIGRVKPGIGGVMEVEDVSPKRELEDERAIVMKVKKMKRRNMCVYSSEDTEGDV